MEKQEGELPEPVCDTSPENRSTQPLPERILQKLADVSRRLAGFASGKAYWLLFSLTFFLRNLYYFRYHPVMDDWFLYHSILSDTWNNYVVEGGKLSIRPLAGLLDLYVVSPLASNLTLVFIVLLVMLLVSAYLFSKTLESNGVHAGAVFLITLVLFPLGMEATYWMSAATRIVTTVFFLAVSLYALDRWAKGGGKRFVVLYLLSNLCSFGFYEIGFPLSIICPILIGIANWKTLRQKWVLFMPVLFGALLAFYYSLSQDAGEIALRGNLIGSFSLQHIKYVIDNLFPAFWNVNITMHYRSFLTGINTLLNDRSIIFVLLAVAASAGFGYKVVRCSDKPFDKELTGVKPVNPYKALVLGFIVFFAGISMHFLIDWARISLRVIFMSFIGLGIMLQAIADMIFRGKTGRIIYGAIVSLTIVLFTVVSVGELSDYRYTSMTDVSIARQMIESENGEKVYTRGHLTLLFVKDTAYINTDTTYYEHIVGAVSNYSMISRCIGFIVGTNDMNNVVPVVNGQTRDFPYIGDEREVYIAFGVEFPDQVVELSIDNDGEDYRLLKRDGSVFGVLIGSGDNDKLFTFQLHA